MKEIIEQYRNEANKCLEITKGYTPEQRESGRWIETIEMLSGHILDLCLKLESQQGKEEKEAVDSGNAISFEYPPVRAMGENPCFDTMKHDAISFIHWLIDNDIVRINLNKSLFRSDEQLYSQYKNKEQ